MRAMISFMGALLISLLLLAVLVGIIMSAGDMFEGGAMAQLARFKTYEPPHEFDINSLLLDPEDEEALDASGLASYYTSTLCDDLKHCIETNLNGEGCEINIKLRQGTAFDIEDFKEALGKCKSSNVLEELYGNTSRKLCRFEPITKLNSLGEDNISLLRHEPYIHGCYIPDSLGSHNVLGDIDSINYLYSGRGTSAGYGFENGGTVRIVMTNTSVKNDFSSTCSYSLYVCGQNAIAASEDETPVSIFENVQELDSSNLYYNKFTVFGGKEEATAFDATAWAFCTSILKFFGSSCGNPPILDAGYNVYGYVPRAYEFEFSSTMPRKELAIIDAIDAGMWEWNKVHFADQKALEYFKDQYYPTISNVYFSYSPIASSTTDSSVSYGSGCWNSEFETEDVFERLKLTFDGDIFSDSPSLYHNFAFSSNEIGDKVSVTLGIKKIFITGKEYDLSIFGFNYDKTSMLEEVNKVLNPDVSSRAILVLDPVTICSE